MIRPSPAQLRRLGQSLREVDPKTLQREGEEGQVRWFTGEAGTELTAWLDPRGALEHVQLTFTRVSVEWSAARGLCTGSFDAGAATAGGRYDPYLLRVGDVADPAVCGAALELLDASPLPQGLLGPLRAALVAA